MKANMLKVFVTFRDKKQKQDKLDMADEFDGSNGVAKLNRVTWLDGVDGCCMSWKGLRS